MSDMAMMNEARRRGCGACVFFLRSTTVSGTQAWGHCVVDAPRTSSNAMWPIVKDDRFCSHWLPNQQVVAS